MGAFKISKDMTSPKPGTKSLPLGTSIFVSVFVSFVSVGLATVGDDDVLTLPDDFGASAFCTSTFGTSTVICTCISTGAEGGTSCGGGAGAVIGFIGLTGLIGLSTFVTFVIDF